LEFIHIKFALDLRLLPMAVLWAVVTLTWWSVQGEIQLATCKNRSVQTTTLKTNDPCLCVFDVDRTLTGYQELLSECPHNSVQDGVKDFAYLYATPRGFGFLTLSELAQGLNSTFCSRCYLGIASAGGAGLDDEKDVLLSVLKDANGDRSTLVSAMPAWTTEDDPSQQVESEPPFVVWCGEGVKHRCVRNIVAWYRTERNVSILYEDVYFFDDKEDNIRPFAGSKFNALQVSCNTRNGSRGLCGGLASEVSPVKGVFLCEDGQQVCLEDIAGEGDPTDLSNSHPFFLATVGVSLMLRIFLLS